MTKETEEMIMETALKIFAERGYLGAKTKAIAEEAGFSEMTLFRKFQTKRNLYNMVMEKNQNKLIVDFEHLFNDDQYDSVDEFMKNFIKNISILIESNFEYIIISTHEGPESSKSGNLNSKLLKALEKYIQNQEIFKDSTLDFEVFTFNVVTFTYFVISDKMRGKLFDDHDEVIDKFISYSVSCIKH